MGTPPKGKQANASFFPNLARSASDGFVAPSLTLRALKLTLRALLEFAQTLDKPS